VIAYLRRHPDAVIRQAPGSLTTAREKLARSLAAYRGGDRHAAQELALSPPISTASSRSSRC
jgi:high-affinity iron transporter